MAMMIKSCPKPINLDIRGMNAVAIVGPNGIGNTLIKSIVRQIPFIHQGEARFGVMSGWATMTRPKVN